MTLMRKMKFDQAGLDGIKMVLSDWAYMEDYRELELINRFKGIMKWPGVVAENLSDDYLLPTSGVANNTIYVSPGACFTPSGSHIQLSGTYSFSVSNPGDSGKYIVAKFVTMNEGAREHRETGVEYYLREVPTSGYASVFFVTSEGPPTTPSTSGDMIWLGKITGFSGNKPLIDTSSTNRWKFDVIYPNMRDFIDWAYSVLNAAGTRTNFENLINTRYSQIVNLLDNRQLPSGRYVQIDAILSPSVLNFRIVDITGSYLPNLRSAQESSTSLTNRTDNTNKLLIEFKWGWDNVEGTGGINSFTVTSPDLDVDANDLEDLFLWIPQISKNLRITGNSATVAGETDLTVEEEDGDDWNGTGVNVTSANYATIHHNADGYKIVAIPLKEDDSEDMRYKQESDIGYGESPVLQHACLSLDVGTYYTIKIKSYKQGEYSSWQQLPAGSYTKYATEQSYDSPTLIMHASIDDTGAAVGAETTINGFLVTITGWDDAEKYEICYTTDNAGASFTDSSHEKVIITEKFFAVTTNIIANYSIKVRPLVSGYQVSDALSTSVISGSAGNSPGDTILISEYIRLDTLDGNITNRQSLGSGRWVVSVDSLIYPAGGSNSIEFSAIDWVGSILTDYNEADFIIERIVPSLVSTGEGNLYIRSLTNPYTPELNSFELNTSLRGRRVYRANKLSVDTELVRLDVDCDIHEGEDVTVRVMQDDKPSLADSLIVSDSETQYSSDLDVQILDVYGDRTIRIDFWDPTTPVGSNKGCFQGRITVVGRAKLPRVNVQSFANRVLNY